ncbi:MAG: hypothetical protein Q9211_003393 [Gyalolechia sp. 1 TL-2023]
MEINVSVALKALLPLILVWTAVAQNAQATLPRVVVRPIQAFSTTLPPSPSGSVSINTRTTTLPDGSVSTITSSTTLPPSPTGSVSINTRITTLPDGSVSTITSSTTLPPPPSGLVSITTRTTTLPDGAVSTVTSSTTLPPPPPPPGGSTVVTTYTTTGSGGSAIVVTSSTKISPPPVGSTAISTFVTTNSQGSSITTTRTSVIPPPASSGTPPPPSYSAACTGAQSYSDNLGFVWHVDCGIDYPGYDLLTVFVSSFELCLQSCDNYVPKAEFSNGAACVAISYGTRDNGGECYLKYFVSETRYFPGFDSANKGGPNVMPQAPTSFSVIPESTTVILQSSTNDQGSVMVSSITSVISSPAPPPTTVVVQSSTNGQGSVVVSSMTSIMSTSTAPPTTVIVQSSTNDQGSVVVSSIASIISSPTPPPTTVVVQSSTNDQGSVVVSSITSIISSPAPPPTTVVVQSSTNDQGSVVVSSITSIISPPAPPPTTVVVQSSTNNQGSVVVSSTTSTAANPNYSASCGGTYSDLLGTSWHVDCSTAYPGNDLPSITVSSFESCLQACDNYPPSPNIANGASCVAVTYGIRTGGGECYLKSNITETLSVGGQDSAYKIESGVRPPVSSSNPPVVVPSPSATDTATLSTPLPNSPPPNTPSPPPSSSTASPPSDRATLFQPCPLSNGQQFIDRSGTVYDVTCSCEYPGFDLATPHYDAFQDCINACDTYVPDPNIAGGQDCVAATWSYGEPGGNCFLKYAIGEIILGNENNCSVKLHNYTIPNSVSSTSTSVALTSTSSSIVTSPPVPATTTTSDNTATTTIPPQISGTATCPADRGAIYTDSFGQTYEIHCGQQVDGDNALSAFHADSFEKCVNICEVLGGCFAVTYPGDTGTDISRSNCYPYTSFRFYSEQAVTDTLLSARVTNGSTSAAFANSVQLCPNYDNLRFTEPIGQTYTIACEQAFVGPNDLYSTVMYTLEACAAYCSLYNTCVAVTFTGFAAGSRDINCFLRTTVGTLAAAAGQSAAYIAA